jgi:hypothetical protein
VRSEDDVGSDVCNSGQCLHPRANTVEIAHVDRIDFNQEVEITRDRESGADFRNGSE